MKSSLDKFRQWAESNRFARLLFKSTTWDKIWASLTLLLFYFLRNEPQTFMIIAGVLIVFNQKRLSDLERKIQHLENSEETTD